MYKLAFATLIGATAALAVPTVASAQQSYHRAQVTCSSQNGRYHSCRLPQRGSARLVHQLSSRACVQGRSWGQSNRSTVWVSRGCRGVFAVREYRRDRDYGNNDHNGGYDHGGINDQGWQRDRNYAVECRSDGRRTTCAWDPRYGNPYLMQRTSGECVQGRDWGYDSHGQIWVDRDCNARFGYH